MIDSLSYESDMLRQSLHHVQNSIAREKNGKANDAANMKVQNSNIGHG